MHDAGDALSGFRLVERLGEGSTGVIWKAIDTSTDREVAIKILPPMLTGNAERFARFKEQAQTVASLEHPQVGEAYWSV